MFDNKTENTCPACGEKMVKIYMPDQKLNLDVCLNGCGGIYFDNREFEKFDETHEDITPLIEAYKDKTFKPVDEDMPRVCPVCNSPMVKNYSSAKREILIDECYNCGGRFLDYKELEKIREEYKDYDEKTTAAIAMLYKEAGTEITTHNAQYGKFKMNSSFLSKITKLFFK